MRCRLRSRSQLWLGGAMRFGCSIWGQIRKLPLLRSLLAFRWIGFLRSQVKKADPTVGVTHNVGGTGGTCVVNVLRRES